MSIITKFITILILLGLFVNCTLKTEVEKRMVKKEEDLPDNEFIDNSSSSGEADATPEDQPATSGLVWKQANLTSYTSYPEPGSEECIYYNGCTWEGMFAGVDGKQTEEWVMNNNIIAIHSKDFDQYKLKTFRLKYGDKVIDAKVYDMCGDSDCNGCCTKNSSETGFLIDVEKYTAERFGHEYGIIEWACLDCE